VWSKLDIRNSTTHPLSATLNNVLNELVSIPTNEDSTIIINQGDNINYYAQDFFTWMQTVTNTTNGIPPDGGRYIPFTSERVIEAMAPYANLTNRHYPTIAMYPSFEEVRTIRDTGGYFIPSKLGASTFISKGFTNELTTVLSSSLGPLSASHRDLGVFASNDVGLTRVQQSGPVITTQTDASWMKHSIIENARSGDIANAVDYKEFVPYQTKEETTKQSDKGLLLRTTPLDPWVGEMNNELTTLADWPVTLSGQNKVGSWYSSIDFYGGPVSSVVVSSRISVSLDDLILKHDNSSIRISSLEFVEASSNGIIVIGPQTYNPLATSYLNVEPSISSSYISALSPTNYVLTRLTGTRSVAYMEFQPYPNPTVLDYANYRNYNMVNGDIVLKTDAPALLEQGAFKVLTGVNAYYIPILRGPSDLTPSTLMGMEYIIQNDWVKIKPTLSMRYEKVLINERKFGYLKVYK